MSQSYKDIELIIIDDGSTDETRTICKEYADNKNILYKKTKNNGVSSARNEGLKMANGYYIAFIDSDDIVSKNYIETLVENIEKSKSELSTALQTKEERFVDGEYSISKDEDIQLDILGKTGGYSPMKLYILDIIKKNNLKFDQKIKACEDLLFNMQYINSIKRACIGSQKHYFYRKHSNSAMNNIHSESWFDIIKVYNIIINNYCSNAAALDKARYNLLLILSEAKYRKKYAKTEYTNDQLDLLYEKNKKKIRKLSIQQKIKPIDTLRAL